MSESSSNSGKGGTFVAGVISTGLLALVLHAKGNENHQKQLQEAFDAGTIEGRGQMQPTIFEKDQRIAQLERALQQKDVQLGRKDADIESLTKTVENLAATIKA